MNSVQTDIPFEEQEEEGAGITLADLWGLLQMQRRVVLGALAACVSVAVIYSVLAERRYSATAVVHLAPMAAQEINTDGVVTEVTAGWNRKIDIATKLSILRSSPLRHEVLRRYEALGVEAAAPISAGALRAATDALSRKNTELIDITVTTSDPQQAARLANITAEVFRDEAMAANNDAVQSARKWLADQLEEYEQRIRSANEALTEFERTNNLAGSTSTGEVSLQTRMSYLQSAYGDLNTQLVLQQTLVDEYERLLRQGRYQDLAKAMGSALIESLTERHAEALAKRAEVSAVFGPKMQQYQAANLAVEAIESELNQEVRKQLSAERAKLDLLKGKESNIVGAIGSGKDQILRQQSLWADYEQRKLELENAKVFYKRLRERMGEVELQAKTQFNRIRVLEAATPPNKASYPIIPLNIGAGVIAGLVLGFGIAIAREWMDDTIASPVDVSAYLKVPFLGAIPKLEDETDETRLALHSHHQPQSQIAEAARAIRTVLELRPSEQSPSRLLVTSAVSAEGKTSTAVRLGIAYANAHRSVVIVDADLRRPRLHRVFHGERTGGLTDMIQGSTDSYVRPSGVDNMSYIASGRAGNRPDELLSAPSLSSVFDELSRQFDIVIVDSPPSAIVADARLLSRHVDGIVLVARENSTPRSLLREALSSLKQVGGTVFGVVINAVDFNQRRTAYKYYGYGYQYIYEEDPVEAAAT